MSAAHDSSTIPAWQDPTREQVRVYVWEWPIRLSHWLMACSIVSLSITGFYLHLPYTSARPYGAWVMGDMRFVHLLSAFVFSVAIALRLVWFFLGNQYVRLNQYLPLAKQQRKNLWQVAKFYLFLSWRPMSFIGHNPLAGLAYFVVYLAALTEILTGFTLYSQTLSTPWIRSAFGWLPRLLDIQYIREIHFLLMFFFWMFFLHHIYTAVLVSIEERSGLMDSIFSGYKFPSREELEHDSKSAH